MYGYTYTCTCVVRITFNDQRNIEKFILQMFIVFGMAPFISCKTPIDLPNNLWQYKFDKEHKLVRSKPKL